MDQLLKTGQHTVTAITRGLDTTKVPSGLKVAEVDYDREETVVEALRGQHFLVITLAGAAPVETQPMLIAAAAKAGVTWVMPNTYGSDFMDKTFASESFTGSRVWDAIEAVEKHGASSWVGVACGKWYEFSLAIHPEWFGFDFDEKKVTFYDDGKQPITSSTLAQCGRAVARLLSLKELPDDEFDTSITLSRWKNKAVYTSSFLVSQRDMLDSVNRVMNRTDADWTIEYEPAKERLERGLAMLKGGNMIGRGTAMYARTFYASGEGNTEERYGLANEALGLPNEDLDEATKKALQLVETRAFKSSYSFANKKMPGKE